MTAGPLSWLPSSYVLLKARTALVELDSAAAAYAVASTMLPDADLGPAAVRYSNAVTAALTASGALVDAIDGLGNGDGAA